MNSKANCKRLGVTQKGLKVLACASDDPFGEAHSENAGHLASGAMRNLWRDRLIVRSDKKTRITDKGRAVVAQARALGW